MSYGCHLKVREQIHREVMDVADYFNHKHYPSPVSYEAERDFERRQSLINNTKVKVLAISKELLKGTGINQAEAISQVTNQISLLVLSGISLDKAIEITRRRYSNEDTTGLPTKEGAG